MPASITSPPASTEGLLPAGREWAGLGVVVAAHVLTVGVLAAGLQPPEPVTPPAVVGVLVSAPPPSVEPPKPLPMEAQPKPRPQPQPQPKPRPAAQPKPAPIKTPVAPPSERAVSAPPPEPQTEVSPPATAAAPPAPPAPAAMPAAVQAEAPAPVVLPRSDAAHLNNPAPMYPPVSRRMGEQGRVLFDVYILPDGTVGEIKLKRSSGHPRLDEAGLNAVRQWRYLPARRGNEAIPYWYVQPLDFALTL